MTSSERAAFVVAALIETILFVASIFGLIGAIIKKQLFTQIYAYIVYVHLFLNLVAAAYLTFEVSRTTSNAKNLACQVAIKDPQAQDQCTGFLNFAAWVYALIAITIIFVELYGAVIVTRYLNQLKREKRSARAMRMDTESAFQLKNRGTTGHLYTRLPDPAPEHELPPLQTYRLESSDVEFNPYIETSIPSNYQQGIAPSLAEAEYGSWNRGQITQEAKESAREVKDPNSLVSLSTQEQNFTTQKKQ
ncbi:hypothetical protein JR316_0002331 [Psilocybe cubensis]|nr:hypothetical protein JR316_0002331 [Psilocybe cubensis]KAH9485423.1 hypothetical protein JR316_0002331 [Psilocybe cubensis]